MTAKATGKPTAKGKPKAKTVKKTTEKAKEPAAPKRNGRDPAVDQAGHERQRGHADRRAYSWL